MHDLCPTAPTLSFVLQPASTSQPSLSCASRDPACWCAVFLPVETAMALAPHSGGDEHRRYSMRRRGQSTDSGKQRLFSFPDGGERVKEKVKVVLHHHNNCVDFSKARAQQKTPEMKWCRAEGRPGRRGRTEEGCWALRLRRAGAPFPRSIDVHGPEITVCVWVMDTQYWAASATFVAQRQSGPLS